MADPPGTSVYASKALEERGIPWNILVAAAFLVIIVFGLWLARHAV